MILAAWAALAGAGEWSPPEPYLVPRLNMQAVSLDGRFTAQAVVGADVGYVSRFSDPPHWTSRSRLGLTGLVGLTSGSFGADARIGSFWGPDMRYLGVSLGPDLFVDGYGAPSSVDYHLPWSPGVAARAQVVVKPVASLSLVNTAAPAWMFVRTRRSPDLALADELTLSTAAVAASDRVRLTLGYAWRFTAIGVIEGFVLAFGI